MTSSERRGLEEIFRLAWADVEVAEPGDFRDDTRADLAGGFAYLRWIIDRSKK